LKILVISYDFPPVNKSAALRAYGFAKYWAEEDVEIKVICASRDRPGIPYNHNHEINKNTSLEVLDIEHVSNKLAPKHEHNNNSGKIRIWLFLKKIIPRFINWLGLGSIFNVSNLWIGPSIQKAVRLYEKWSYDVVFTTFGPPGAHYVGAYLKNKFPIVWIADYRDLWSNGDLTTVRWPFNHLEGMVEKKVVRKADLIVTISEPFVQYLRDIFPAHKIVAIENGFDFEEKISLPAKQNANTKISLIYTGNISLEHRDPEPLFYTIKQIMVEVTDLESKLEIVFYTLDRQIIENLNHKYATDNIIKLGDFLDRNNILKRQSESDALIFFEWNNKSVKGVFTGKLFEYMNAGVPVISIGGNGDEDASRLIVENGFGVACGNDISRIKSVLMDITVGNSTLNYNPDQAVLEYFSRKEQAKRLLVMIEEIAQQKHHQN
jgi:glycosyltransferase involved in cell wall biosynthesis